MPDFDGRARFGTAHWKLDALGEYAGNRPLAWIDDSLDESCHAVGGASDGADAAGARPSRTSASLRAHTDALLAWVRDGYTALRAVSL